MRARDRKYEKRIIVTTQPDLQFNTLGVFYDFLENLVYVVQAMCRLVLCIFNYQIILTPGI